MAQLLDSLISQLNLKFDLERFLSATNLSKNLKRAVDFYYADCPFHKVNNIQTFSINLKARTFSCKTPGCFAENGGRLIDFYAKINNIPIDEAAIKIFEDIGIESPEDNQPLIRNLFLNIAEKSESEGLNESAKYTLIKAYQQFPKNLIILSRLANIYAKEKDIAKACNYLIQAVEIVREMRNYTSAHSTLRRILTLDPYNEEALRIKDEVIYKEWEDYLTDKITKEEKDNFSKRISFKEMPMELRVKIIRLLFEYGKIELFSDVIKDYDEEFIQGKKENKTRFFDMLYENFDNSTNLDSGYLFLAENFIETGFVEKAINCLNLAKEAAIKGKISTPPIEIEEKLEKLEESLFQNDLMSAKKFTDEGNMAQASAIYKKIIDTGIKKHEIYEAYIVCEYKLGNEENAVNACISLSDFFYRRDNHIGALISLYRGLNFLPDYQPLIDKICSLYSSLGYNELADEIKVEVEKRKNLLKAKPIEARQPVRIFSQTQKTEIAKSEREEIPKVSEKKEPVEQKRAPIPLDSDLDLDMPVSLTSKMKIAQPRSSSQTAQSKAAQTSMPSSNPEAEQKKSDEIPFEMTVSFRLSGSGISTDLASVIEAKTISIGSASCKIRLENESILGLPSASINYTLSNAQIIMFASLPNKVEPIRLFGRISKVQSNKIKSGVERILNIEFIEDDYPDRKIFLEFLNKPQKNIGKDKERKSSTTSFEPVKPFKMPPSSRQDYNNAPSLRKPQPAPSDVALIGSSFTKRNQSTIGGKGKISVVSIRFVGYRSGDGKPLQPIPAKFIRLENNTIEVDFGALEIPGVREASLNYFLRTNKQILIEFDNPANKEKLQFSGETANSKTRREGGKFLFSAEIEIKDIENRAAQTFIKLMA